MGGNDSILLVSDSTVVGSKSVPGSPPTDLPAWVLATTAPRTRARKRTGGEIAVPDHDSGKVRRDEDVRLVGREAGGRRRRRTRRATRLEPLLTVGETAAILNVSSRTVRRLISSGAIPAISIRRSVRLRPQDIERLIADGEVCNG
jgi:excisionase family DNA binding protein